MMPPNQIINYPTVSVVIGLKKPNRKSRRKQRFGELSRFDEIDGRLAPKKRREWQ